MAKGTHMQTQQTRKQSVHCPNLSATVLRDDGSSVATRITRLWYDGCDLALVENLDVGEKIKVVIRGMGSIDAHVISTAEGTLSAHFIEDCPV
jgi:hypothetical protein